MRRNPLLLTALAMAAIMSDGNAPRGDTTLPSTGSQPRVLDEAARDAKRAKRAERSARRYAKSNRKVEPTS